MALGCRCFGGLLLWVCLLWNSLCLDFLLWDLWLVLVSFLGLTDYVLG